MAKKFGKGSILAWMVWVIATSFFFWDYLQEVAPSSMGPSWMTSFHIDETTIGIIAALYFYSYGLMQIPVGLIADHYGPHRPMILAVLTAVGGNIVLALAGGPVSAGIGRMLTGFGSAFSYVCCLKLISNWFDEGRFATLAGLTALVGMAAGISGEAPLAFAVGAFGWRTTVWILASVGIVLAVVIAFVVRDHPARTVRWEDHPQKQRGPKKTWSDLKHVLTSRQTWLCGIFVSGVNSVFFVFGALWGAGFLEKVHGVGSEQAAAAMSMLFVGGIPGSIFFGWFSDRIRRRRLPMIAAGTGVLAAMVCLLYVPSLPLPLIYILLLAVGFLCTAYVVAFALAHDVRPPGSAGVSMAFVNTCSVASSAILQPVVGAILDAIVGKGKPTAGDYRMALTVITAFLAVALLASILTKETHCRSTHHDS
jgi:MFS family permease